MQAARRSCQVSALKREQAEAVKGGIRGEDAGVGAVRFSQFERLRERSEPRVVPGEARTTPDYVGV